VVLHTFSYIVFQEKKKVKKTFVLGEKILFLKSR